jgi:branched-chain amino acid transport system ATP-binding protein
MLKVDKLCAGYGDVQILRNVSIEIGESEIVGIVGSNGAGKTTLIRSIMGRTTIYSGSIFMEGTELTKVAPYDVVLYGVGLAMEGRGLFPQMSVRENLIMGSISKNAKQNRKIQMEKVLELFPALKNKLNRIAGSLSGGEQQMVSIGRAIMTSPKLLILDEVSLGLAPVVVENIYKMLIELKKQGISLMVVEQNVYLCLNVADRAYIIENGSITGEGYGQDLLNDPTIKEKYLGV